MKSHYKCHICDQRFQGVHGRRDIQRHLIKHQRNLNRTTKSPDKKSGKLERGPKPKIVCNCGKSFQYLSYYNRHANREEYNLMHVMKRKSSGAPEPEVNRQDVQLPTAMDLLFHK